MDNLSKIEWLHDNGYMPDYILREKRKISIGKL